jgi:beta-glucosidase
MKSVKFISLSVAALLACTTVFAQSLDFSVSGKVVLANGSPVGDATITYMNIAKRLSWDFSKSDGTFGGYSVQAVQPVQQNATITLLGEGPVSIDIFDLSGKKVGSVYNAKIDKGVYALEPITSKLSKSMYMLKIKAGDQVIYRKLVKTGIRTGSAVAYQLSSSNTPMVLAKKLAVIDSIRVGKTGYAATFVPIQSYADVVGNVTIAPVDIEGQVNTIFGTMTQLQKCGQLAMPQNGGVNAGTAASNNVGSVFGGGGALIGSSAGASADFIDGIQRGMMNNSATKIPVMVAYDFVHGASAVPGATMFPHNLGMGAIQDTVLIQKAFRVCAFEVRGSGANWGFGPCIAVIRDDRWGRAYEGFCETPERTQIMAHNAVRGCQTTDLSLPTAYAACCKHFAGDGNTTDGVNQGQTVGPDATARLINLPGYSAAVAAGVATIMPSFSSWCDGTAMHRNKPLLTDWLKTGLQGGPSFKGFVVGDWEAGWPLPASMDAGLDVPMAPGAGIGIINGNGGVNFNAYYAGDQARYDDAVKRVLRVKYWMNLFSPGQYLTDRRLTALVGCAEHRDVARACVRASMVLLKNANATLPMPKTANVAVWGQAGDDVGIQCGGWTVSWQGGAGGVAGATSIKAGMQAVGTGGTVSYVSSPSAVGNSDYIVAVLSENPYAETSFGNVAITGNDATGSNGNVITQIAAAHAAGKKVIGILIAGRALDISGVINNCDAFIWACLPGSEGKGVAELLYADQGYKFTGKLQVTWPNNANDEPINSGDGKTGLFAYGFGLSD